MKEDQNALVIFQEELGELAMEILSLQQQVSKAIRFGIDEQRDLPTSNKDRIESEWNDLLGSLENLARHGINLEPNLEAINKKLAKIEKYSTYSKQPNQVNSTDKYFKPDVCPITLMPFFMWIEHPDLGWQPTYGGPYDSYTLAVPTNLSEKGKMEFYDIEFTYEHYCHDEGVWVGQEVSHMKIVSEEKLLELGVWGDL